MERHQRMVLQQRVRSRPVYGDGPSGLERVAPGARSCEEEERDAEADDRRPRDERIVGAPESGAP